MNRRRRQWLMPVALCTLAAAALGSCKDPMPIDVVPVAPDELEDCAASADWLPSTSPVRLYKPEPHPETECPFYRGVWNNFLIALQPDAQGNPALLAYPTIDSVFQRVNHPHGPNFSYLGDVKQAGFRQIVIDQNGNTLYYGIHMNQAFADFIHANRLETAKAIQNVHTDNPNLYFPAGLVEFKSAWQVVDMAHPPADLDTFIVINTTVPTLTQDPQTHAIIEDRETPRPVTVRLLAIHVVYTYPGHPELIWGSMEHTNVDVSKGESDTKAADGHRDVAPVIGQGSPEVLNPTLDDPDNAHDATVVDANDFILYKGGTKAQDGDAGAATDQTNLVLDAPTQSFPGQGTSIYRMFPASKSNDTAPDDAITSLNHNVEALFAQTTLPANDKRGHYRLVGAQWMDKPAYFRNDFVIQNDDSSPFVTGPYTDQEGVFHRAPLSSTAFADAIKADGSDSEFSILAGEDRMSSTAMESFTQGASSFFNCFTCHNTQAVTANGVSFNRNKGPGAVKLLEPGLLNVSHLLSQFVLEECNDAANLRLNPDGSQTAVCP
jgi:hypothetical protein